MEDIGNIEIYNEIIQLKDLFQRRLLDDKLKSQMINELSFRLDDQKFLPLFREIILLLDRIEANLHVSAGIDSEHNDFILSIYEELLNIFRHYGFEQLETSMIYDSTVQKIVSTIDDSETPYMTVIQVVRKGYKLNGSIVRPEEVIVSINQKENRNDESECS